MSEFLQAGTNNVSNDPITDIGSKSLDIPLIKQGAAEPSNATLAEAVERTVNGYLETMSGQSIEDLYELVLSEVEAPLLQCILNATGDNQSRTATMLGLNRGTLRKKLKKYGLL